MKRNHVWGFLLAFVLADGAVAQADAGAYARDLALLRRVYAWDEPAITAPLRVANQASYPAFVLLPVAVWAAEGEWQPAAQMVASEAAAGVIVMALKYTVRRPRPYATHADLPLRSDRTDRAVLARDSYGFPSGHATFAFAAATSLSLTHPEWYVVVPAQVWAGAVSVSRLWHGAHYPSDILAGAAIGFVAAGAVHALWPESKRAAGATMAPVVLRVRF